MSAIWGNIEFGKKISSVSSMADEYNRKCKLDRIREVHYKNSIIGAGLLHINPEDEYEQMPYTLEGRDTVIVADAFLDNREELYLELSQAGFWGDDIDKIPDGKMICAAYEKWGYDFVKYIKGIYSIAVYDASEEKLFICTDRTSSRCLYYHKGEETVTFSTLISPIKKLFPDIPLNDMYMKDFIVLPGLLPNISSDETPWNGIYIIEAGCSVTITAENVVINRYYSPQKQELPKDIKKLKGMFLDTYKKAVKRAIRTDKEVGIALSGGLDSTSVAVLAAPLLKEENKKLYSYTYVPQHDMASYYEDRQITNETFLVKETAKMYPNIEATFTDNGGRGCFEYIDELIDVMEIPFKAFVNIPLLLEIYRSAAERGCKVFLNGQTGNSTVSFGDIDQTIYHLCRKKRYYTAFKYFNGFCKTAGFSRRKAIPVELKRLFEQRKKSFVQVELDESLVSPFLNISVLNEYSLVQRNKSGMPFNDNTLMTSDKMKYEVYTLPALSYIGSMETKLGLYTGIVIRDATRDSDIVDFALSFPFEFYAYDGIPRYLVRGFMEDIIPKSILYPIDKTGVQSADWILRLADQKDIILSRISEMIEKMEAESCLSFSRIRKYLNEKKDFTKENESEYAYLLIAYMYAKYKYKMLQI